MRVVDLKILMLIYLVWGLLNFTSAVWLLLCETLIYLVFDLVCLNLPFLLLRPVYILSCSIWLFYKVDRFVFV